MEFPNDDRVFHNVFSFHDGKRFDLGLYPVGAVKHVPFDQPGLSRIFCNIHPQMAAYVMVVDTPYFAVSDRDGPFRDSGVPAGSYTYHAWRPGGQILNGSVDRGRRHRRSTSDGHEASRSRSSLLLARGDAPAARASRCTPKVDVTAGSSTEDVGAGGLQIRLFGANEAGLALLSSKRPWAARPTAASDAFGAAYPYDRTLRPIETYGEKMFEPGDGRCVGIKAGRYRTPFGIYGRSDHAYNGFLRAPLIRYGGNWALSNTFLEAGADVLVGRPALYVETSVGVPQDASRDAQEVRARRGRPRAGVLPLAHRRGELPAHAAERHTVLRSRRHGLPRCRRPVDA